MSTQPPPDAAFEAENQPTPFQDVENQDDQRDEALPIPDDFVDGQSDDDDDEDGE